MTTHTPPPTITPPPHGLGRVFAPDSRDASYPVSTLLSLIPEESAPTPRTYRYWFANGWWGDQGQTPQCVAYAWTHWLEDGPVSQPNPPPIILPSTLYDEAQKVDEWPGENYDGTSVRAGAKVLQSRGFISSYHWATTLDEIVQTILTLGPVVVGTNWYDDMFYPDDLNYIHVGGSEVGGHAYLLDGVNVKARCFRMKNSWGRNWGFSGFSLLPFNDMEVLLSENGEACLGLEVKK